MEISTQDYGYSSSKTTSTKTMESLEDKYGEKFDDYLKKFEELSADGLISVEESAHMRPSESMAYMEIMNVKNANGDNIIDEAYENFKKSDFQNYSPELTTYMNNLIEKNMDNPDAKNVWMMFEVSNQYNAYKNGEDVDSIFVVGKDGNFGSGNSSTINDKDVDIQNFVDKMIEIFTQKLGNSSGDLKDKYQDLVDNYQQMKEEIETNKTNSYKGSSFYA